MTLWGKKDTVYSTGNVTAIAINNDGDAEITGNGTTWNTGNGVVSGLVITMGTKGSGVVKSVDSTTQLTLVGATGLTAETGLTQSYNLSEQPKFLVTDSNYGADDIYGVDNTEVGVARGTAYSVAHGGWVGITSYVDSNGNTRVKTEVLVAMGKGKDSDGSDDTGGISGDAENDKYANS